MTPKIYEAIEAFLIAVEADGRTDGTIEWYANILNQMAAQLGMARLVDDVTSTELRIHLTSIKAHSSANTHHNHARALHRFWRWQSREYGTDNPMGNIAYPRQPKPDAPKMAAKLDDIHALYLAIGDDAIGRRDKAIISFLIDTACRVSTIPALTLAHLDLQNRRAYTVEKGAKPRALHFTTFTAEALERWLAVRPRSTEYVFTSMKTGQPLTHDGVNQLMKRLAQRAGVTGRVNPHAFRHAFAREYIRSGGDLATLSRILGHSDTALTSQYYAIFTDDEIASKHNKHSPANSLGLDKPTDPR
jgi:site-specific recombinase XerD